MPSSEEDQGHLALSREVARRLALMLERESLLQEAATIDAFARRRPCQIELYRHHRARAADPADFTPGYAELLRRDEVEPSRRDRWLDILQVEAAQLGLVLDQFLDVSRLESGLVQGETTLSGSCGDHRPCLRGVYCPGHAERSLLGGEMCRPSSRAFTPTQPMSSAYCATWFRTP